MISSIVLIIIIIVIFIIVSICFVYCHFVGDSGRSYEESPAPYFPVRALGGKSCSCHEEFQGTCKDCLFVQHNGHGLTPDVAEGDKGFAAFIADDSSNSNKPPTDPFRGFLQDPASNTGATNAGPTVIEESIGLTSMSMS